ncbi:hypothetical protein SLEP1_g14874 [Rubroshorea leprosula]|uniref:Reverse transcriptase Ty1/copia-type domain-containing protein n=1 Tax=Rubroshorea leprosula TaxID=152421 RepID=A0AAV5IX89_9ROSI|nr:hypothetical protein SLEP1_g14874 [Rubroshorea leprosula]
MAVHLLNILPSTRLHFSTPHEMLFGVVPNYTYLRTFGCACYPNLSATTSHKLAPRSTLCIFLGYPTHHKGYRCLDLATNKIILSRHVVFAENSFPYKSLPINYPNPTSSSNFRAPFHLFDAVLPPPIQPHTTSPHVPSSPTRVASCPPLPPTSPTHAHPSGSTCSPHVPSSPAVAASLPSTHDVSSHAGTSFAAAPVDAPTVPRSSVEASAVGSSTSSTATSSFSHAVSHGGRTHTMVTRSQDGTRKIRVLPSLLATDCALHEPKTFKEASADPNWCTAMAEEFSALLRNNTWSLVPCPPDANVVGSKWVYRIKQKADGSVERLKARLVAQGYTQQPGIDYDETVSPVVKPVTIRVVLSLAVMRSWPIHQLDVKNAFLNGTLSETVYMSQPPGFIDSAHPDYVCKLHQAIYGLKQAPRAWFHRFTSFLLSCGFVQAKSDWSLFVFRKGDLMAYLLLYVDDIILTASSSSLLAKIISLLQSEFWMTDLGSLNYFLGISAHFNATGLFLSQFKYVADLLAKSGMRDCKPASTPLSPKMKLMVDDGALYHDPSLYRSLVGALHYLTFTRPDIAFAVGQVCQFMHKPTTSHFQAVKRILRYLKGTMDYGLQLYHHSLLSLHMFTDADWAGCVDTRRSVSGYCLFLGNSLISWSSKKQHTVARSSAEAEYRALANAAAEVLWVRQLLFELYTFLPTAPVLFCDNLSAIYLSLNPIQHQRTKHIEIDIHFVREKIASGILSIRHVSSYFQRADVLTKALSMPLFHTQRANLNVICMPAQIEGG